jgi:hypothetical protein
MGWDVRGKRRYYYKSKRIGDRVKRVYLGAGESAQKAATEDAAKKAKRAEDETALATFKATLAGVDNLTLDAHDGVGLLTDAALLAAGFHKHRAQWRRRIGFVTTEMAASG